MKMGDLVLGAFQRGALSKEATVRSKWWNKDPVAASVASLKDS